MKNSLCKTGVGLSLLLLMLAFVSPVFAADFTIGSDPLQSKKRVSRTQYQYTLKPESPIIAGNL